MLVTELGMVTDDRFVQAENALLPMLVTELGITIDPIPQALISVLLAVSMRQLLSA